jgi:hypothetical protein
VESCNDSDDSFRAADSDADEAVDEAIDLATEVESRSPAKSRSKPKPKPSKSKPKSNSKSKSKAESKAPLKMKLCYIAVRLLMILRNIILSGYAARMHPKFPTRFEAEARTQLLAEYNEGDVFMQFACRLARLVRPPVAVPTAPRRL